MRPPSALPRGTRVGLDTSLFIYFLQDHPRFGEWCATLFTRIEQRHLEAVTSTISLLEVLVQPYRDRDDELAQKMYALLATYPGIGWIPVTIEVADRAADLRARYNLKTPDAIQVATALTQHASLFLAGDKAFKRVKEIECVILEVTP